MIFDKYQVKLDSCDFAEKAVSLVSSCSPRNTVSVFDNFIKSHPKYSLKESYCGSNILFYAIAASNIPLINRIAQIGGKEILNLQNDFDQTPLLYAISFSKKPKKNITVIKEIIKQGADVNKTGCFEYLPCNHKITPLTMAISKSNSIAVRCLLVNKAVPCCTESKNSQEMITKAFEEISKCTLLLLAAEDLHSAFSATFFPKDVLKKIVDMHFWAQ